MSATPDASRLQGLQERIGYRFSDLALLEEALTHISYLTPRALAKGPAKARYYQRLEFLGDRVLGLAISDLLYAAMPDAKEGDLARRLAELVRRETCAEVAESWNIGPLMRLGQGEIRTGGDSKIALLADMAEAVIGAVFRDGGWEAARGVVERGWQARLDARPRRLVDPKSALQEWAQARGLPPPAYTQSARSGPEHKPEFVVAVEVQGYAPLIGPPDASKKAAAQSAARAFLVQHGIWNDDEHKMRKP